MSGFPATSPPARPDPLDACRLLTVAELSALLKLSPRTIWRLVALAEAGRGDFPRAIRIGKLRRFRATDVASYLAALAGGGRRA